MAEKLRVSESKVQRMLALFQSEQQIEQQTASNCRLITVKNWCQYQKAGQRNESKMNSKRTTDEQRMNTNKESENKRIRESNTGEGEGATPRQEAIAFFQDPTAQEALVQAIASRSGAPEEFLRSEVGKFVGYWTERTQDGKREKWQTMDTFEVKRRLATWLSKAQRYAPKKTYTPPRVV